MDTCPVLRQRGQMLLLMAFLLIALLGMIGVAVDLGFGYEHRREAQNAADSAAMAGALALGRHIQYDKLSAAERLQLNLLSDPFGTGDVITQEVTNAAVMSMPPFPRPNAASGALSTNLSWPPSAATGSLTANWIMRDGTSSAIGGGTPPTTAVGVRVIADASYPTYFARVLGPWFQNVAVEGTSRAVLRPAAGGVGGAPFIVCGSNAAGGGTWEAPNGPSRQILTNASPPDVDYASWVGHNFMVHWAQIGANPAPGTDCGAGSNMNGLAQFGSTCSPTGTALTPCTEPWRGGTVSGTTTTVVAGLPGCTGSTWNNCVMILPVAAGCDGTNCNVVTFAPFLIMDGTLPVNGALAPQSGCNNNCHIGQLLPAGMINSQPGTGVINPATNPGLFTVELSCDPVGADCPL
jgi:hypothetical protein